MLGNNLQRQVFSETNLFLQKSQRQQKNELRDLEELLVESVQSVLESSNEEVLLLLPMEATKSTSVTVQKPHPKVFNMRIKDEIRIDLKRCEPSMSFGSLVGISYNNKIHPIEEMSEGSKCSETAVQTRKRENAEEVERIFREAMEKARHRPKTRKAWETPEPKERPSFALERYLEEAEAPLETTDRDKLLDPISFSSCRRSRSTLQDWSDASTVVSSGCCVASCFRKIGKLCGKARKK